MTTSYGDDANKRVANVPQPDADGLQTWNPSVGLYHKVQANQRESYGGIVAALQDLMVQQGLTPIKSYPHNFAGIIAAIQDLAFGQHEVPVHPDVNPGGGTIIINPITGLPEWIDNPAKEDGLLWFDTRQGRLFVSIEGEWYQTNGADGLAYVTHEVDATTPDPVIGQFWWKGEEAKLYIFDGYWLDANNNVELNKPANGTPIWRLVFAGDETLQTTATVPLAATGPKGRMGSIALEDYEYLQDVDISAEEFNVQQDYNIWLFETLLLMNRKLENAPAISETAPLDPEVGDLWFDPVALELSIYYEDADSKQWVPTTAVHRYEADLDTLSVAVAAEQSARIYSINSLNEEVNTERAFSAYEREQLSNRIFAVQEILGALEIPSIEGLLDQEDLSNLQTQINLVLSTLRSEIPDISGLQTKVDTNALRSDLLNRIAELPTEGRVLEVLAAIPDISALPNRTEVTEQLNNALLGYLSPNGGKLLGSLVMEKQDLADASIDFSSAPWYSNQAFKFKSNSTGNQTITFGTTDALRELAYEFEAGEDLCWIADGNKVASISDDGVACTQLKLVDFGANSENGRTLLNTIDVKDRLIRYQTAMEQMRQAVASSTDFDSLKSSLSTALAGV